MYDGEALDFTVGDSSVFSPLSAGDMLWSDLRNSQPFSYGFGDDGKSISGAQFYEGDKFGEVLNKPSIFTIDSMGFRPVDDLYGFKEGLEALRPGAGDPNLLRKILSAIMGASRGLASGAGAGGQQRGRTLNRGIPQVGGQSQISFGDIYGGRGGSQNVIGPAEYAAAGAKDFNKFLDFMSAVGPMLYGNRMSGSNGP